MCEIVQLKPQLPRLLLRNGPTDVGARLGCPNFPNSEKKQTAVAGAAWPCYFLIGNQSWQELDF
jgi:hypothetical protein